MHAYLSHACYMLETRKGASVNMHDLHLVDVFYFLGGSLILLALILWLSVTLYLYILHRRYAHIPSPTMPRYYAINS